MRSGFHICSLIGLLLSCFCLCAAHSALAGQKALPSIVGPILVTAGSQIYGMADVPGASVQANLAAHGYIEEEYFLSGEANIYGYDEQQHIVIRQRDVPYTTRLLIRRPKDATKFSGNVQFEPMHPIYGLTPTWTACFEYILRHGDIYAALGVGADPMSRQAAQGPTPVASPLIVKWFDPKRYAPLQWPDEDGIRWDVIMQAARLLKSEAASPLAGLHVERMYASGWSYTASLWRTFINEGFHDQALDAAGRPLFSGYLIGISSSSFIGGYLPINSSSEALPADDPKRITRVIAAPVIELLSENEALTNRGPQAPDMDEPRARHRLYEVPGISHGDGLYTGDVRASALTVQLREHKHQSFIVNTLAPSGCSVQRSDLPMRHLAMGALANLDRWTRDNIAPPRAERVAVDNAHALGLKDANGNTRGGVRMAVLDVPLAKYGAYEGNDQPRCHSAGSYFTIVRQPFDKTQLTALYRSRDDFMNRFKARVDQLVRDRWIMQPEADVELQNAALAAQDAFD